MHFLHRSFCSTQLLSSRLRPGFLAPVCRLLGSISAGSILPYVPLTFSLMLCLPARPHSDLFPPSRSLCKSRRSPTSGRSYALSFPIQPRSADVCEIRCIRHPHAVLFSACGYFLIGSLSLATVCAFSLHPFSWFLPVYPSRSPSRGHCPSITFAFSLGIFLLLPPFPLSPFPSLCSLFVISLSLLPTLGVALPIHPFQLVCTSQERADVRLTRL
jgi:hypothetical protein